jgi:alpha-N-arabinofuranosidase
MIRKHIFAPAVMFTLAVALSRSLLAASATIDIDVNKPGPQIAPTFYGLMTEEINHSYDGGLFAELIQNRTFQDPKPKEAADSDAPIHWSLIKEGSGAKLAIDKSDPVTPALPLSLRLDLAGGRAGAANDGYWGIPVRPRMKYTATFYAKGANGFDGPVTAAIVTDDGNVTVAKADSPAISNEWKKYTLELLTGDDAPATAKAKFVLFASGKGSVSFSLVSLFPPTYMDTPNGLRSDLMKLMADLHPAFIRLPGGNYVEGSTFETRFNWKQMIGPAEQRPGHMGCWSYRSSDGFGIPQYLLWCKQLNAEPVLAVFAGYVLNRDHVDAGPKMQQYVDEALEEIEYVSGPADSTWGKRRAEDGFPEPFELHYVEIGNEDWFDRSGSYEGRFTQMFDAIRAKYPKLKIIATAPVKGRTPDLYDDHYYRGAYDMANDSGHYDPGDRGPLRFSGGHFNGTFDRSESAPKYFIGEWATEEGSPTPDLNAALADAVWLMGLERNADIIPMECYAPLFVNVNEADAAKGYPRAWQWRTNLIGYDAMTAFGSPSYYAQAMLGQNKGDVVLPTKLTIEQPATQATPPPTPHGAIGIGSWHTDAEYKDIVVTSADGQKLLDADAAVLSAAKFAHGKWKVDGDTVRSDSTTAETWGLLGETKWTDYTVKLKARKLAGNEGFLVIYHAADSDDLMWWNVGGWRNSKTQIEDRHGGGSRAIGQPSSFVVEPNKWYDLRVEVKGRHARCFIDDKLVNEADEPLTLPGQGLFASAVYASGSHEAIVKIVNMGSEPISAEINLRGAADVKPDALAIVLSGSPKDVNTIDQPTKVAPKEERLTTAAAKMERTIPPHSLTLLRVKAATAGF